MGARRAEEERIRKAIEEKEAEDRRKKEEEEKLRAEKEEQERKMKAEAEKREAELQEKLRKEQGLLRKTQLETSPIVTLVKPRPHINLRVWIPMWTPPSQTCWETSLTRWRRRTPRTWSTARPTLPHRTRTRLK